MDDLPEGENAEAVGILLQRPDKLTEWELNFMRSIAEWLVRGNKLTSKQQVKLGDIWERVMNQ